MTEPSPSPIPSPTPPSDQSWLDWLLTSLDSLGTSHPSLTWAPALILTTIPSVYLLWRKLRSKLQQKIQGLRTSKEHQKLPPIELPFTVEVGEQRLTLEPTQPQHENTPDGMSNVRLLSAKSTPVPFLDRAETLTRLEMWARSEERFAIHILGGDGGSGKTRLGVELCRRLTEPNAHRRGGEVWKAGFLQNIAQSDHTSSNDDTSSLLIVMDYAEGQPEMVTEIINFALRAAENPERQRLRILFLVRRPSPLSAFHRSSNMWLDALRPQDSKDEGLNRLLDEASTITLNDEELSNPERRELFTQAFRSFTRSPDFAPSTDLTGRLSNPMYSQPLLVIVDAFLNAQTRPDSQINCSPKELFEGVLHHEENYWVEHWPSTLAINTDQNQQNRSSTTPTDKQDEKRLSLNRELARQAVAAATLTNIRDEKDAINLLNLLPANPDKNTKDLAQWLRDCYPPHMNTNGQKALWCDHLEPDRIGEHLVTSEADNLDSLLRELLSPHRVGRSSLRTWTVLERSSGDPQLREKVGQILNDVLVEVTQTLQAQVVDSQSPDLATGFAKLLSAVRSHVEPDKAHEAEQTLSEGGYFTAFLECELAQCAADISRPTDESPETERAAYASRKLSLSRCLAASGRRDEALKTAQEATNLYRTLAKHNPAAYTPELAMSLNNLANSQAENGQRYEALKTAQEATNLYRTLAKHNPGAYNPSLAMSLNNLALHLAEDGQRDKALKAAQEATDRYHDLAREDREVYDPNYATSLNNLAKYLAEDGQRDEALTTARKAVSIRRRLADQNPAIYAPYLAMSLNNLAIYLSQVGQRSESLTTIRESISLYRRLADQSPATYIPELAKSLNNLALRLAEDGQHDEALKTVQEAVDIYQGLVRSEPHTFSRDFIRCLNTRASILEHFDEPEEAARIRQERAGALKRIEEMEAGDN